MGLRRPWPIHAPPSGRSRSDPRCPRTPGGDARVSINLQSSRNTVDAEAIVIAACATPGILRSPSPSDPAGTPAHELPQPGRGPVRLVRSREDDTDVEG